MEVGFMLDRHACVGSQPTSSRRSALMTVEVHSHPLAFIQSSSKAPKYTMTPRVHSWICLSWMFSKCSVALGDPAWRLVGRVLSALPETNYSITWTQSPPR